MRVPKAVKVLREHQEEDELVGSLFRALHTFIDRTRAEFYAEWPEMPYPVVAMEKDRRKRLGYYTQKDGYTLIHRINLNPYALRTGWEAAETLAHELVHLWQMHVGRPCKNNYHGREFHEMMAAYGIVTDGRGGYHKGYTDDGVWAVWKKRNEDLQLENFVLPGMDAKEPRKMLKLVCPDCGTNFRSRRKIDVLCIPCHVPFEVAKPTKARPAVAS